MSITLIATGFDDKGNEISLALPRFQAGITTSASVDRDDLVHFSPRHIMIEIKGMIHKWEPAGSEVAPVSWLQGTILKELTKEDIESLRGIGFKNHE